MAICSLATAEACCSNESEAAASRGRRGGNGGSSRKDMILSQRRIRIKCPYSTFKSPFRCWTCRLSMQVPRLAVAASPAGSWKTGKGVFRPGDPIPPISATVQTADRFCAPFSFFFFGAGFLRCGREGNIGLSAEGSKGGMARGGGVHVIFPSAIPPLCGFHF